MDDSARAPRVCGALVVQSLFLLCCPLAELLHTSRLIKASVLTRIEGVGGARDFNKLHRVFLALKADGLVRVNGRADQKLDARSLVDKDDQAVGVRMDVLLHSALDYTLEGVLLQLELFKLRNHVHNDGVRRRSAITRDGEGGLGVNRLA